jgi:NADPH:quinone reductase-like Zn-dependent oxidoreductase
MNIIFFTYIIYKYLLMESGLKAVIFGATGAVGKTLVPLLVESNSWSKVLCVVRKELPEW